MKILLVDDTKKHREAGIIQLSALGHEIIVFSSYEEAVNLVTSGEIPDVALIDLLMPTEGMKLGGPSLKYLGEPIGIGYSLAMKLALEGVKFVGVVTDICHHQHPASAIMDWFLGKKLDICGGRVQFMSAVITVEGTKDWANALSSLID